MKREELFAEMLDGNLCDEDCESCKYAKKHFCRMERQTDRIWGKYFASNNVNVDRVINGMIDKYGEDSQIEVAIEEMSELIKELIKYMRSKIHEQEKVTYRREHIVEEMGDVMFMMKYLMRIFGVSIAELDKIVEEKADRTDQRYLVISKEDFKKWVEDHATRDDPFPQCRWSGCDGASIDGCYICPDRVRDFPRKTTE